ncbi:MAG: RidA family protein [Duodenibacillus sp.]|nr:RidA family protein [Duodenibacillus sp.]
MKSIISTQKAPAAIGPYSQAVITGGLIFTSGQIGLDPQTGSLVEGIEAQSLRVMENLKEVLAAAGCTFADVVKFTVFIADLKDFALVNKIMAEQVPEPFPARSCVQIAALPKGALVEIEAIAQIPQK